MKRPMQARVRTYLTLRRNFGYQLQAEGQYLLSFARYADQGGHRGPPTKALMLRWARDSRRQRSTWARRLKIMRVFAKYWQGFEPKTEIPPRQVFGPGPTRPTPYLYDPPQIRQLLQRGRQLPDWLESRTYATLLGLLACTGLRLSEALGLGVNEVDLSQGVLHISQSKYHKVRWVPLHPTTVQPLHRYSRQRHRLFPKAERFFVNKAGQLLTRAMVESKFRQLRRGLVTNGRLPRLHDLRHTFACRVLLRWQNQAQGAVNRLAVLACYLGHNRVADTYWYLQAFPALLSQASRHFTPPIA
jgi:integrase